MNNTKNTILLASFLTLAFVSLAPAQATYDPVDYFMLTPGLWRIEDFRQPGQPNSGQRACVVSQVGKFIVQNEFDRQGNNWVPVGGRYFEVTPTALLYHGDYNSFNNNYALNVPPISIPRSMKVGDVVQQKLTLQEPQGAAQVSFTFMLTADNVTKKVKAGTYNGCLRFEYGFLSDEVTESGIEIHAKKAGAVWIAESELDSSEPEATMASAEVSERAQ